MGDVVELEQAQIERQRWILDVLDRLPALGFSKAVLNKADKAQWNQWREAIDKTNATRQDVAKAIDMLMEAGDANFRCLPTLISAIHQARTERVRGENQARESWNHRGQGNSPQKRAWQMWCNREIAKEMSGRAPHPILTRARQPGQYLAAKKFWIENYFATEGASDGSTREST